MQPKLMSGLEKPCVSGPVDLEVTTPGLELEVLTGSSGVCWKMYFDFFEDLFEHFIHLK